MIRIDPSSSVVTVTIDGSVLSATAVGLTAAPSSLTIVFCTGGGVAVASATCVVATVVAGAASGSSVESVPVAAKSPTVRAAPMKAAASAPTKNRMPSRFLGAFCTSGSGAEGGGQAESVP